MDDSHPIKRTIPNQFFFSFFRSLTTVSAIGLLSNSEFQSSWYIHPNRPPKHHRTRRPPGTEVSRRPGEAPPTAMAGARQGKESVLFKFAITLVSPLCDRCHSKQGDPPDQTIRSDQVGSPTSSSTRHPTGREE